MNVPGFRVCVSRHHRTSMLRSRHRACLIPGPQPATEHSRAGGRIYILIGVEATHVVRPPQRRRNTSRSPRWCSRRRRASASSSRSAWLITRATTTATPIDKTTQTTAPTPIHHHTRESMSYRKICRTDNGHSDLYGQRVTVKSSWFAFYAARSAQWSFTQASFGVASNKGTPHGHQ